MKLDHLTGFLFTAFFFCFVARPLCGVGGVLSIRRKTSSNCLESLLMPQPLSRVRADAGMYIGNIPDDTLSKRPQLAVLAMRAINSWSNVEAFLLRLFVSILGG